MTRERLFDPLGLSRTVTLPEEVLRFRSAFGHVVEPNEPPKLAPAWHLPRSTGPAGVISSTAGELLALASRAFDVFVTVDRNLAFQQDLTSLPMPVIILRARTNRLADLKPLVPKLLAAIGSAEPGKPIMVSL